MRLLFILLLSPLFVNAQKVTSIPVEEGASFRLIDEDGNYISNLDFETIGTFVNGFAQVRKNGKFGFINEAGKLVVPCVYLHVENIRDNRAIVYNESGRPLLISAKGDTILKGKYSMIKYMATNRYSVLNENSIFLCDGNGKALKRSEINSNIKEFIGPYEIHTKLVQPIKFSSKGFKYEFALKDSFGNYIIDFGAFEKITYLGRNIFLMEDSSFKHIKKANLENLYSYHKDSIELIDDFKNGPARIQRNDSTKEYMFPNGKLLTLNNSYSIYLPFRKNATFIQKDGFYYFLSAIAPFDSSKKYSQISRNNFINGTTKVKYQNQYGVIDTLGNWSIKPIFNSILDYDIELDYVIGTRNKLDYNNIYNLKGELLSTIDTTLTFSHTIKTNPVRFYYKSKYENLILKPNGEIIWKHKNVKATPRKYKTITFNYIYNVFPGMYPSIDSSMLQSTSNLDTFSNKAMQLIVRKTDQLYKNNFYANEILLINNTSDTLRIETMSGKFKILTEALTPSGNWQLIQGFYFYPSCGNSYYTINFPPKSYYKYIQPQYFGHYKTKIRYVYHNGSHRIISKEISASINLQQFWYPNWKNLYYGN